MRDWLCPVIHGDLTSGPSCGVLDDSSSCRGRYCSAFVCHSCAWCFIEPSRGVLDVSSSYRGKALVLHLLACHSSCLFFITFFSPSARATSLSCFSFHTTDKIQEVLRTIWIFNPLWISIQPEAILCIAWKKLGHQPFSSNVCEVSSNQRAFLPH